MQSTITHHHETRQNPVLLTVLTTKEYSHWRNAQPRSVQNWLEAIAFTAKAGQHALLADEEGGLRGVVAIVDATPDIWSIAHLPAVLPEGVYALQAEGKDMAALALGWQLATYRFTRYKKSAEKTFPQLLLPESVALKPIDTMAEAIFLIRDLINRPANDLTPYALASAAEEVAQQHQAHIRVIRDEALLEENFPLIHAVGRASANPPCLIDMQWGDEDAPKVTLVGKGVCFDSGGLDLKSASNMLLMKKDMGGAAHVLGLAHLIMSTGLAVRLRVLIAAAENSVSANAFRPKDIIESRKGITVEIGNTDAEGRLVLCDALTEADAEQPELLLDFATLTGAARVALGTDIPALFTKDDALAEALAKYSAAHNDPLWRLPLWQGYREFLDSDVADINNAANTGFGGAITAALYLHEFVQEAKSYAHIDLMAWNSKSRPGRPVGGEAMAIRAVFAFLQSRYAALP